MIFLYSMEGLPFSGKVDDCNFFFVKYSKLYLFFNHVDNSEERRWRWIRANEEFVINISVVVTIIVIYFKNRR